MSDHTVTGLWAGAAERVITPPVGVPLVGYASRASGDLNSRYIHDDLSIKALALRSGENAWAVLAADLIGLDAVAVEQIRAAVAARTGLKPEAILVSATHTHAGPPVCPIAAAVAPEKLNAVDSSGRVTANYGQAPAALSPTAFHAGATDLVWKENMLARAVEATVEAWQACQPAEAACFQAEVEGVASSRRVHLSDGTWADPRRDLPPDTRVVSRTEIDPFVRGLAVRQRPSGAPLAVFINYATHPWIFNTSGISAELAGAVSRQVAQAWGASASAAPVAVYCTGPQGDVTMIWNINMDQVWRMRPGENLLEALPRRERGFDAELTRLGGRVAGPVLAALAGPLEWKADLELEAHRHEFSLPLKAGYAPPPEIILADWQRGAPAGTHRTEMQVLRAGAWVLLALPGEPFTSLGRAIRARSPYADLLLVAVTNDYGPVSYMAERADFERGGYELIVSPAAVEAGETLVAEATAFLNACAAAAQEIRP